MGHLRLAIILGVVSCLAACGPTPQRELPSVETLQAQAPVGPLPRVASPLSYDLTLRVDPRELNFGGTAVIRVSLSEAAGGIWLHGQGLDVSAVRLRAGAAEFEGRWVDVLPSGVAWLSFQRRLVPGEVTIEIDYTAPFDANLSGLFRVEEQGDAYALAKSESVQARKFLPGFDEPRYKAPFKVSLIIPEDDVAITNSPELRREPADEGFVKIDYKETRPLPTYLLSLAVGPFDEVEVAPMPPNDIRSWSVPLKGYTRVGRGEQIAYALETAPEIVRVFEEAFKVPYPYEKLDIVAAPQWPSGATELAAAITYRETRILYGESSGPAVRRSLLDVHSHEIAHMWFGDLVTPPWWDDLWLKEAFASWGTMVSLGTRRHAPRQPVECAGGTRTNHAQ